MLLDSPSHVEQSSATTGRDPDFVDFLNAQLDAQPTTDSDVDRMWDEEQERNGGDLAATIDGCLRRVALGQMDRMNK
jgi:hypothetical protein